MARRIRMGFRTAQLALILTVLVTTLLAVGATAFSYARGSVRDLSDQILVQASERIDLQVRRLVDMAVAHGEVARAMAVSGRIDPDDAPAMLGLFVSTVRAEPRLTYLSFGTERGEYWHVVRSPSGALGLQELRIAPEGRVQRDWELIDGGRRLVHEEVDPAFDPRLRPYYEAVRAAGRPIWTESYVFADREALRDVTGVTRAVPVEIAGALVGVLTVDLDLISLSDYLAVARLGHSGFAFLLEERDGGRRLIAHPRRDLLSRASAVDAEVIEAIPADESPDPIVRAFSRALPSEAIDPEGAVVPLRLNVDGQDWLGAYKRVGGPDAPPWVLCAVLPVSDVMTRVDGMTRTMAFVASLGVLAALLLGLWVARILSRTLGDLEEEMGAIARFELRPRLLADKHSGIRELDDMRAATDAMKVGLRSFGRYVPTELVRQLVIDGGEARLGATHEEITVVLADIAGFTTLVESQSPEQVLDALGGYLTEMNVAILGTGGTVCQYLGDAVQAFWGAPVRQKDHAVRACRAALDMRRRTQLLALEAEKRGLPRLDTRFGVMSGKALVGNFGAPDRFNYGCVGDPVSVASHLEGLNKVYGTGILIADATARRLKGAFVTRPVDRVLLPGREDGVLIHELVGEPDAVSIVTRNGLAKYAAGLAALENGRFEDAKAALLRAQELLGDADGPCLVMLALLASLEARAQVAPGYPGPSDPRDTTGGS